MTNGRPIASILAAVLMLGCSVVRVSVPIDPAATFTAHQEHRGLVVDRLARGRSGLLRAANFSLFSGAATWVLESDGQPVAGLWLSDRRVTVRRTAAAASDLVGEVVPAWEDGEIRLTLAPAGAPLLHTDRYARVQVGAGPSTLTRAMQNVVELRGRFQAAVEDANGASIGWLRVAIGPYQPAPRIFDGVLPDTLPPELVVAAVVALNTEIDWIEEHALNVYGETEGAPLGRSLGIGH